MMPPGDGLPAHDAAHAGEYNISAQKKADNVIIPVMELEQLERHYIAILTTLWRLQGKRRKIIALK